MSLPALQRTVSDIVSEYDEKAANLTTEIQHYADAQVRLEMSAMVQGKFVDPVLDHRPYLDEERLRKILLKSGWRCLYDRLQIDRIASANDKRLFERAIEDPPKLTFENAKATFGDYFANTRFHILRGLAETFSGLDAAYKSHSKVKIGVKGLPKRVILRSFGGYGSYGRDKLRDIINALAAYRGHPLADADEFSAIAAAHSNGEDAILDGRTYTRVRRYDKDEAFSTCDRGLTVRGYQNGNAHVLFSKETLRDINMALAEFYGDVLPDVEDDGVAHQPGTDVAKELQYYWSSGDVINRALEAAGIHGQNYYSGDLPHYHVLEPSCGDGRILDALTALNCSVLGIEYHAGRAAQARQKGHPVQTANFLECPPKPEFDKVVMNPPFYGRHYLKHVRHALKFLKPGGTLVTVLPATAWYDHKELKGDWRDLPVASFAKAGTNVPTGLLRIKASKVGTLA